MSRATKQFPLLSEMDKALIKRYNLSKILDNRQFVSAIADIMRLYQKNNLNGISLSQAIKLISILFGDSDIFYETVHSTNPSIDKDEFERLKQVMSFAVIDKLSQDGYLERASEYSSDKGDVNKKPSINQKVFIISGRNRTHALELSRLLAEINLVPIDLASIPAKGRTIVEKFDEYSNVGMAIAIFDCASMNPEDRLCEASQNTLVELGYFLGLLGRNRVLCLVQEGVQLPTDMAGIIYISFSNSIFEKRTVILQELKTAGYSL